MRFIASHGILGATMATELDQARYINLLSYKKNGDGVETPVWAAPLDGKLVVFSNENAYKVKRIRRNPAVRVARCDARGKLLGEWLDASAEIVEDKAEQKRVMEAIDRKYGWQFRFMNFFATIVGRAKKRAYLAISVKSA